MMENRSRISNVLLETKKEDLMGGEGFDNPAYGFGDTIGGSFAGFGRMTRACNIPNEIQPTTPPDGLLLRGLTLGTVPGKCSFTEL